MAKFKGFHALKKTDLLTLIETGTVTLADGTVINYDDNEIYVCEEDLATTEEAGPVLLATDEDIFLGEDKTKAVTPNQLKGEIERCKKYYFSGYFDQVLTAIDGTVNLTEDLLVPSFVSNGLVYDEENKRITIPKSGAYKVHLTIQGHSGEFDAQIRYYTPGGTNNIGTIDTPGDQTATIDTIIKFSEVEERGVNGWIQARVNVSGSVRGVFLTIQEI